MTRSRKPRDAFYRAPGAPARTERASHERISNDLERFLAAGGTIEVLGTTQTLHRLQVTPDRPQAPDRPEPGRPGNLR